ncbi:hypothetical protein [Nocardia brasiliensis]|uniref:hypothetical protein n=1 Tax=Nocardia brasiliensis TaxID=37326 RepID=UPI00366AA3F9
MVAFVGGKGGVFVEGGALEVARGEVVGALDIGGRDGAGVADGGEPVVVGVAEDVDGVGEVVVDVVVDWVG